MIFLVIFLLLLLALAIFVIVRLTKRLFQFDEVFEKIAPVLEAYSNELKKTLSQGLLEEHPEVQAFHKLNMFALTQIELVTQDVTALAPKKKPKLPHNALPPLVE